MRKGILDLYTDFLTSLFGKSTVTGLVQSLEVAISYDQVTKMLSSPKMISIEWWRLINPTRMRTRSFVGTTIIPKVAWSKEQLYDH